MQIYLSWFFFNSMTLQNQFQIFESSFSHVNIFNTFSQSQGREIASLRTRNVELEGDVERLRRNLTSEKFERERAVQELRRHNINPPIPTMEYSSYPGYNRSFTARARSRSRSRSPSPSRSVNNLFFLNFKTEYCAFNHTCISHGINLQASFF